MSTGTLPDTASIYRTKVVATGDFAVDGRGAGLSQLRGACRGKGSSGL
jgi:hypothetical protein